MREFGIKYRIIYGLCLATPLLAGAKTGLYRLSWREDPATTMVVGWCQLSGTNPEVCYGKNDFGTDANRYPKVHGVDRQDVHLGMTNCFARLKNLSPDTAYYFVVRDSGGAGRRIWFRTAPARPKSFAFVSGGDSRLDYGQSDGIRSTRCAGNRLVAKLRPLFVLYGGDYVFNEDSGRWKKWMEDWQLTIADDGRMPPIVAILGNHEKYDSNVIGHFFDTPNLDQYYALDFGGNLMRLWVLNSELRQNSPEAEAQNRWLTEDLEKHKNTKWKMAAYHRPMRPHTIHKPQGNRMVKWWTGLFLKYGMDVVAESDTHLCKRTYPIRPSHEAGSSEGFIRDDARGTVYIGSGSWAAPMKPANNLKPWTMAAEMVNQFKWIKVSPKAMEIRAVLFENVDQVVPLTENNLLQEPKGMVFWKPESGEVLRLPFNPKDPGYSPPSLWKTLFPMQSSWDWSLDGKSWQQGRAPLGYGDSKVKTPVAPAGQKPRRVFFRKRFDIDTDLRKIKWLRLHVQVDDGCVVFLNSTEVFRFNLPKGKLSPEMRAVKRVGGEKEDWVYPFEIDPTLLKQGKNTLRVQVYQHSPNSSDLLFDSRLEIGIKRDRP